MKKTLLAVFLFAFVVAGVADQSWAMGKRSRGGSSRYNHNQGGSSRYHHNQSDSNSGFESSQNSGEEGSSEEENGSFKIASLDEGNDADSGNPNEGNNQNQYPSESFFDSQDSSNEEFPAATTVPEPATLSLLGMGMAAALLRRRKK